jgi:predicted dehydrogenase
MTRVLAVLLLCLPAFAADIRLGIIGTDTSHVIAFTKSFNGPEGEGHVSGAKIVAAYKGGSPDVESSAGRVDKFAAQLKDEWKIEFVDDIATLCSKVDGILLESVDGRPHLEQARQVIAAGKPLFIDKPLSATLDDAREIARLAKAAGVPWFSSSSLRWSPIVLELKPHMKDAVGAATWGPGPTEPHHYLDLSWYAIHATEMLYALMGPGCIEVTRTASEGMDTVVGRWKDGRLGTVNSVRPYGGFGGVAFLAKGMKQGPADSKSSYIPLLEKIVTFFETGEPPVPNDVTLELFAFMDAAQRSKEQGGKPVKLR